MTPARTTTKIFIRAIAVAFATLVGCTASPPASPVARRAHASPRRCRDESSADVKFEASPSGVAEIDIDWVHDNGCSVRVVDVRESDELVANGLIEGAEHVPIARLSEAAASWNPREPVVLVCRSGRRSGRGVLALERLGFDRVASMTGGMLAWRQAGYPVTWRFAPPPPPTAAPGPVDGTLLGRALRETPPRRVRAASLLLFGSESCVDGREDHAVLGTPGGDAGELLLALATVEEVMQTELDERTVVALFDAYLESFGRFYFHTDEHALGHLRDELRADPRFAAVPLDGDTVETANLVRHPPPSLRAALLEHLLQPANVGCGHLRLVLTYPEDYGVRLDLARTLGRVVFQRFWDEPESIDFVVLRGSHEEEAVVNVAMDGPVHAFSNVPAIPPRIAGHSVFVNHPEVAAFVRREHAAFFFEEIEALSSSGVTLEDLESALAEKAAVQLGETVDHLAAGLPVFELRFEGDEVTLSETTTTSEESK